MNGGQQPPPPTAATCKNPYVDGEIPLPGEPAVPGQAGGGVSAATTAAAAAGGAKRLLGLLRLVGSSGTGWSSAGGSAGSVEWWSATSGAYDERAERRADRRRDVVVNGHLVRKLQPACPDRFTCADALLAATHQVGTGSGLYIGWAMVVLAVIVGPPLFAMYRRRRLDRWRRRTGRSSGGEARDPSTRSRSMAAHVGRSLLQWKDHEVILG